MEFDTDKLVNALKNGLNPNDCKPEDLEGLLKDSEEDVQSLSDRRTGEISQEQADKDMAYELHSMGARRTIGPLELEASIGNVVLLNVIDSPFVSGELEGEVSFEDVCKTLYVLQGGREVLQPVMSISERIEDLYRLKDVCKDNPTMCDKVIAKVEEISNARADFELAAMEFYSKHFTGDQLQEVFEGIFRLMSDLFKSVEELGEGGKSKKKP